MTDFVNRLSSTSPTLVDFYATWCGPCQMMHPILEQLQKSIGDKCKIEKVDIDKEPDVAALYQVRSVPTLILFHNGEVKWRATGVRPASDLKYIIDQYCQ